MTHLLRALCALSFALACLPAPPADAATARQIAAAMRRIDAQARKPRPRAKAPRKIARKPAVRRAYRRAAVSRYRRYKPRPAAVARKPADPPVPMFYGDLYIQSPATPLWSVPGGGQQLGSLPRATLVTNMGRQGDYYKVEAPNGAVGFVSARALGKTSPPW